MLFFVHIEKICSGDVIETCKKKFEELKMHETKDRNAILFFLGIANAHGKAEGAMYFMIDHIFKKYANTATIFDFGGSNVESIANFNKNFGAKDCVYLQVKKNSLPVIVKWISGKS